MSSASAKGREVEVSTLQRCLPTEVLISIFSSLRPKDLLSCACVCWQWNLASEQNVLWKRHVLSRNIMDKAKIPPEKAAGLAQQTSWKFVFMSTMAILSRKVCPHFWNDVELYWDLQCNRKRVPRWYACNGIFWLTLQLELRSTQILSPLIRPTSSILEQLNSHLLVLTKHYGTAQVLEKLKEAAMLPSASILSSPRPKITSSLLLQLTQTHVVVESTPCSSWPPPTTSYFNWDTYFRQPVQETVIAALRYWVDLAGHDEWEAMVDGVAVDSWMRQLAEEPFWIGNTRTLIMSIAEHASMKALSRRSLYSSISVPETHFILEKHITPQLAAERLSHWSYTHLHKLPEMDLLRYLASEQQEHSQLPLTWLLSRYQDKLAQTLTSHCTSDIPLRRKVDVVHRVLDICVLQKELKDFMTLKTLWAAVGAVMAQHQITHLSWNDIQFKDCMKFGQLRELLGHKDCYAAYFRCVRRLQGERFVPYFPAHRQMCQQARLSRSPEQHECFHRCIDGKEGRAGTSKSTSLAVCSGDHRAWWQYARGSGISLCELLSVEHMLIYKLGSEQ